ncbi:type II toxin-antitoxin system ParD family antitoxin [Thalassotalea crassostreae]|uniref:type II toxin-antitoxin system ParD family antitoxin n=1 Tax=Thalassotalea crassostreae TaxID=1763536 RepID=UPI000837D93C|nr:type II toxin-antitoxin system ParD family antitoxin [Thalassotalea crassostreae]
MAVVRKTITFTEQQDAWLKSRVNSGDYTNDSEYVRDLIRKDQQNNEKLRVLQSAIEEGLASGVSKRSVVDIMKDVEAKIEING